MLKRNETLVSHEGKALPIHTGEASQLEARLLVGDDEPRLLASLCSILREEGFEVDAAADGLSVCRHAQSGNYDLILLNICMPEMDGLEVMSWLKEAGLSIPIVIISGASDFQTVRQALRTGAYDYIRKPYDVGELIRIVCEAVRSDRQVRLHASKQLSWRISEEFFRRALNHLPDIIFSLDDRGRINFLNGRVEGLLGFRPEELIGRHFSYLVDEGDVSQVPLLFAKNSHLEPFSHEIKLRTYNKDAANLVCEITVISTEEESPWPPDDSEFSSMPAHFFGIARNITERKKAQAVMEFRASHDLLTGLPNRALFLDRLTLAISQASRNERKLATLFIDLNDFKAVNDTFGHGIGDQLLQSVAIRLKSCLREGDTLSRYGGDEFTVLLPALGEKNDVTVVAGKLLESLKTPFRLEEEDVYVSVGASIGIALFPDDGFEAVELLERADKAMYEVKQRRKNDYNFYS